MIRYFGLAAVIAAALFGVWKYAQGEGASETPEQVSSLKAVESVPVDTPHSKVKYPSHAKLKVGDTEVDLTITGTAIRKKFSIKAYAIASYVKTGETPKNADEICQNAQMKMMHIVMERNATGKDFIDAFRDAVGKQRATGEFKAEFAKLTEGLNDVKVEAGNTILLINVPAKGLAIRIGERPELAIDTPEFAKAIWEIYLGGKPVDDEMKKGLVSQLTK